MQVIYSSDVLLFCNIIPQHIGAFSHLGTHYNSEDVEVEVAVHEWLLMQGPGFCCDRIFKFVRK